MHSNGFPHFIEIMVAFDYKRNMRIIKQKITIKTHLFSALKKIIGFWSIVVVESRHFIKHLYKWIITEKETCCRDQRFCFALRRLKLNYISWINIFHSAGFWNYSLIFNLLWSLKYRTRLFHKTKMFDITYVIVLSKICKNYKMKCNNSYIISMCF